MVIRLALAAALATALASLALGCGPNTRPAVVQDMTTLPSAPEKRQERLESAQATPTPEQRGKPLSPKMRKVETAAATAAAIVGTIFSSNPSTLMGVASGVDENSLVERAKPLPRESSPDKSVGPQAAGDEPVFGPTLED